MWQVFICNNGRGLVYRYTWMNLHTVLLYGSLQGLCNVAGVLKADALTSMMRACRARHHMSHITYRGFISTHSSFSFQLQVVVISKDLKRFGFSWWLSVLRMWNEVCWSWQIWRNTDGLYLGSFTVCAYWNWNEPHDINNSLKVRPCQLPPDTAQYIAIVNAQVQGTIP